MLNVEMRTYTYIGSTIVQIYYTILADIVRHTIPGGMNIFTNIFACFHRTSEPKKKFRIIQFSCVFPYCFVF